LTRKTDLIDDDKEPVFITKNTRKLRNGKTFLTKHDDVSKFCFKIFDCPSTSYLKCFKIDIFEEKLCSFNTWSNNNISYIFEFLLKTSSILIEH
jgi:hypothetical protein